MPRPPEREIAPAFSVIVPLEFHRGLAEKCLRAWSSGQEYPQERFEILVAAPERFSSAELKVIKSLLRPRDRLLLFPLRHDMDLVAAAAREARGDVLLFTEAHCLPNPDVLRRAEATLRREPQWAGFSGGSIPVTHNLLSEIEADMYDSDIRRNMEQHPWLKVLDQIFVLRRTVYAACGGIEAEYGHFAEWVIAARLHARGLHIGYEPSVAVHHYYIGELDDLVDFTEDFGRGQMRFALKNDMIGYFDPPACWMGRCEFLPKVARAMLRLVWRDRAAFATHEDKKARALRCWSWLRSSMAGMAFAWRSACSAVRISRERTEHCLAASDRAGARDAFHEMIKACAAKGHLSVLRSEWDLRADAAFAKFKPVKKSGSWDWKDFGCAIAAGFLSGAEVGGRKFCWTSTEAMLWLPLAPGKYELRVEWFGFAQIPGHERYRFYIDERRAPAHHMLELPNGMEIRVHVTSRRGVRLGWACAPFHSPGDARALGMPLSGVTWKLLKDTAILRGSEPPGGRKAAPPWQPRDFNKRAPLYFLHVEKCMGTAIRFFLENAFPAGQILDPWHRSYHLNELPNVNFLREPRRFVCGHYRWDLPERVPDRDWRIITVLRDPAERLLSKFDYMKEMGRLPSMLDLKEWLQTEIRVQDFITGYFVAGSEDDSKHGAHEVAPWLRQNIDDAINHLRQCVAVGIQERAEESLNLLAWTTGSLPPAELHTVNRTQRRNFLDKLGAEEKTLLDEVTFVDRLLYEEGRKMFEAQHAAMLEHLRREGGGNPANHEVRATLRSRSLSRLEHEQSTQSGRDDVVTWRPDDVFPGENLDSRERHHEISLRWTGPHDQTFFRFFLESEVAWDVVIRLHLATPVEHAGAAELWVDVHGIPLHLVSEPTGTALELRGRITPAMLAHGTGMRRFVLKSPVKQMNQDRRKLGLCLRGMEFHRCRPEG